MDLAGHPLPGVDLGIDIVDRYARAIEADARGFSTNPTLYFRFTRPHDALSLDGALEIVDITPGSPTYAQRIEPLWDTRPRSRYLCPNTLAIRAPHGAPLRPATTYAALISTNVRPDATGGAASFARAADFEAMLEASPPADASLALAHTAYAPLRAYLPDVARDPGSVLTATVFTTQPVDTLPQRLREAARAGPAPALAGVTRCDAGVTSPCDDGTPDRACVAEGPDFVELHGRLALPIFQHGTAPYDVPEDGGGIEVNASGVPTIARTEGVCFALTIPKAPMPLAGWPLLVHAGAESESFRAAVQSGVATDLAAPDAAVRAATLAIELPQHGERRGTSTTSTARLLYNFNNPRAARDNIAQGAADLFSVIYFATTYAADAATSPTGESLDFDASRIVLLADGQGAIHAALALPWETDVSAAVVSGIGGDFASTLLTRSAPIDFARLLPHSLRDRDSGDALRGGEWHPALALLQQYFDSVDPVNYARRLGAEPPSDDGRHVFLVVGFDGGRTNPMLGSVARAGGFPIVRPVLSDLGLAEIDPPASANRAVGTGLRTQALRQYASPAVGTAPYNVLGRADVLRFLQRALAGETPPIGE